MVTHLGISTPAAAQACKTVVPGGTRTRLSSTNTSTGAGWEGGVIVPNTAVQEDPKII